ncbi:ATP-binding protein [Yinghuangia sp. YIM S09857]|uniref:ATP-binding protein n=1 Tax=Yinghuangia sp. YIM S09857 TaxID=3436929 RepID=UPI003F536031
MSTTRSRGTRSWRIGRRDGDNVLVVDMDGMPGSVGVARHATAEFLASAREGQRLDTSDAAVSDVLLVVTELVSNACRHAPGPCRLTVALTHDAADVAVLDSGHGHLRIEGRDAARPGYGLLIVARLADGVRVLPSPGGKVVRASVPLPSVWPRLTLL